MQILTFPLMALLSGAANAGKLMLVAVVSTAGVLALWLLPIILGCGALSTAYCLCHNSVRLRDFHARAFVVAANGNHHERGQARRFERCGRQECDG